MQGSTLWGAVFVNFQNAAGFKPHFKFDFSLLFFSSFYTYSAVICLKTKIFFISLALYSEQYGSLPLVASKFIEMFPQ